MFKKVWGDYKVLLRSIPASTVTLFIVSVIMMNLKQGAHQPALAGA